MIIFDPYKWDPETDVKSTNVPEDDPYLIWNSGTRYISGSIVTTGTGENQKTWQAQYGVINPSILGSSVPVLYNEAKDPTKSNLVGYYNDGSPLPNKDKYQHVGEQWWLDATGNNFLENRYRMFNPNPSQKTTNKSEILVQVSPAEAWDSLALFNIGAEGIEIELANGPTYSYSQSLKYSSPLSSDFPNQGTFALVDLPLVDPAIYPNAKLILRLWSSDDKIVFLGYFAVGIRIQIGTTLYGTELGIVDYSRKERDVFGDIAIIERGYTDTVKYNFEAVTDGLGQTKHYLASLRAKAAVYIGSVLLPETIIYGWYRDFLLPEDALELSTGNIEVESIIQDSPTEAEPFLNRVVFVELNGDHCINKHLGQSIRLCPAEGLLSEQAIATTLDIQVGVLDTVSWNIEWIQGDNSSVHGVSSFLSTNCDQYLPLYRWPQNLDDTVTEGVAYLHCSITKPDTTTIVLDPATIIVGCEGDGCCTGTPVIDNYGFWNNETKLYDVLESTCTVNIEATEIPEGPLSNGYRDWPALAVKGCAGERLFWCDVTPHTGYGLYDVKVTLAGADAGLLCAYVDWWYATPDSEHSVCGADFVTWLNSYSADSMILVICLTASDKYEDATIEVECTFSVAGG